MSQTFDQWWGNQRAQVTGNPRPVAHLAWEAGAAAEREGLAAEVKLAVGAAAEARARAELAEKDRDMYRARCWKALASPSGDVAAILRGDVAL